MISGSADLSSTKLPLETSPRGNAVSSQATTAAHQEQIFSYMDQLRREVVENVSSQNRTETTIIVGRIKEEMALFSGDESKKVVLTSSKEQTDLRGVSPVDDNSPLELSDAQRYATAALKLQDKLRQRRMKRNDPSAK